MLPHFPEHPQSDLGRILSHSKKSLLCFFYWHILKILFPFQELPNPLSKGTAGPREQEQTNTVCQKEGSPTSVACCHRKPHSQARPWSILAAAGGTERLYKDLMDLGRQQEVNFGCHRSLFNLVLNIQLGSITKDIHKSNSNKLLPTAGCFYLYL